MGPLRLNLSRSGVGVSAGVRGARVNVGPRGNYVNFGMGGLQYRKKLRNPTRDEWRVIEQSQGNIATASVGELAAASPDWVVQDSQLRLRRWNLFKAYCWRAVIAFFIVWINADGAVTLTALVLFIAGGVVLRQWDSERRTARIAMILSEDAPALEHSLHRHFLASQMNKVNPRKEFFRVSIATIREEIEKLGIQASWTMTSAAAEHKQSLAIEKAIRENPASYEAWVNKQLILDAEMAIMDERDMAEAS